MLIAIVCLGLFSAVTGIALGKQLGESWWLEIQVETQAGTIEELRDEIDKQRDTIRDLESTIAKRDETIQDYDRIVDGIDNLLNNKPMSTQSESWSGT